MKITKGPVRRCRLTRNLWGKDALLLDDTEFLLADPEIQLTLINKDVRKSPVVMFLAALLGLTIIGLILAVPLWIAYGTRVSATIRIDTPQVSGMVGVVDDREWKIVSKYISG